MPKRIKTKYPGVYYREANRIAGKGKEKVFYIVFKKKGKTIEEKAGRQYADDMTPARAAGIRSERIEGKRLSKKEIKEKALNAAKLLTIDQLWDKYKLTRKDNKGLSVDAGRYNKYIKPKFGHKNPAAMQLTEIDTFTRSLARNLAPQTVAHRASCRNYEYFIEIVFGRFTVIIFYSIFCFFTRKRAVGYF